MKKTRSHRSPQTVTVKGRTGTIYAWKDGRFGTSYRLAGVPIKNSFATHKNAYEYLKRELSKTEVTLNQSTELYPLRHEIRDYHELEQTLKHQCDGATLREAVTFYIRNHKNNFRPLSVDECSEKYLEHLLQQNCRIAHRKTVEKHLRRFRKKFGSRNIDEITTLEINDYLNSATYLHSKTGQPVRWSVKTRNNNRGSLVSMANYAKYTLNAISKFIPVNEFESSIRPKIEVTEKVEIYSPEEMEILLKTAVENDVSLIPLLVLGGFQGMRPSEIHGEHPREATSKNSNVKRNEDKRIQLKWSALNWEHGKLDITDQKVRGISPRNFEIHAATREWLYPFRSRTGRIWHFSSAYEKKMERLHSKAKIRRKYDGLRHSYASYRLPILDNNLNKLANEMGNSPAQILSNYKQVVDKKIAEAWFAIRPPDYYGIITDQL